MPSILTESDVEEAALEILSELGYKTLYGPDIAPAPDGIAPERQSYSDVVLVERLRDAIDRFNPNIPEEEFDSGALFCGNVRKSNQEISK